MKHVIIHTDGACKGNPGPGGWGAVLSFGERETVTFKLPRALVDA